MWVTLNDQNVPKRHMWVTLNDFGLTLEPLCGHLLTFVGPRWAYKQLTYTFTSVLNPGGGGKCKVGTGRPQGGHEEATRRPRRGHKEAMSCWLALPNYVVVTT